MGVLALLILSTAGECVAPSSSASLQMSQTSLADASDVRSASLNDRVKNDLRCVDEKLVRRYAKEFGVDFRLILAMIKHESQFDEDAVSERGAQGLMQIMPVTHSELSEELDVEDPMLPEANLRAGVYYVAKLCELFKDANAHDRVCLALAAYNAGPSRIYDAQELAAYLGENPRSWSSIRTVLPLLSKRYYSLHHSVWSASRPPNGYFGSSRQTIRYVENIMKTYQSYRSQS